MTRDKKILIYLMIMQKLDLKLFTNENKMKLKEKDLKYYKITNSSCTGKSW